MSNTSTSPVVTRDPRFGAGRKLVTGGLPSQAVEIFATLLEETRHKYGDASIESAPAYYEYGNSLLRTALRNSAEEAAEASVDGADDAVRKNAASAALARQQMNPGVADATVKDEDEVNNDDKKPAAKEGSSTSAASSSATTSPVTSAQQQESPANTKPDLADDKLADGNDEDDEQEDIALGLEMMENAYSILDDTRKKEDAKAAHQYSAWIQQQIPRVLLGLGDVLSALDRHADAADAYSRALEHREAALQTEAATLECLQAHRQVAEATILIAEELLSCPPGEDVVTTETQALVVTAAERVEYARGYYDKARDALQEAVFTMGNVAARSIELGTEKEDICFIATMIMGVGTTLAELDEAAEESKALEPEKKKAKR